MVATKAIIDNWEEKTNAFLKDATGVIHVGANTGQEREIYAAHGLPVLWIEPLPGIFEKLVENLGGYLNQHAACRLLTDCDGVEYEFGIANNGGQSSSIFPFAEHKKIWPDVDYSSTVRLKSTTLKNLINIANIDLKLYNTLILDVQGAELLVLKGAGEHLSQFRFIRCEAADVELYKGACLLKDLDEYLLPRGFERVETWQAISKPGIGQTYEALYQRSGEQSLKLNLGGGLTQIPGYTNIDHITGGEVYPLALASNRAEVIRASHILEHFPVDDLANVLADWVRVLKPGGVLKIAVPDFKWIAEKYLAGADLPLCAYLMGGQQNADDFHKSVFDKASLESLLEKAGLVDVQPWESEIDDCARYPVSLNLQGTKPERKAKPVDSSESLEVSARVAAIMSVPRLGWQDNFGAAWTALRAPGWDIPLWKFSGAFWEMCIQNGFEDLIEDGVEWIITIDYDTLFERADIQELLTLAAMYPEADCIVPIQAKRNNDVVMFTMRDAAGKMRTEADAAEFDRDLTPIHTGHFGLTLIKTAALAKMPKPWFWSQPTAEGRWREGRTDADIYFWEKAQACGLGVFQANKIRIGHLQLVASEVDEGFNVFHRYLPERRKEKEKSEAL